MAMAYIEMVHSSKRYQMGSTTIVANDDVSFGIEKGELAIILGASGAGKSTVLNILGGMDTNSEGRVVIDGRDISGYSAKQLTAYRRTDIGFVFQFYNLVANLTARENVELASQIVADAMDPVKALADVGLADRVDNFPAQLSGGEQQRVAIARAVAKNPKILLCDEPTGALDYNTGKQVLRILQDMSRENGATVVIVTHNSAIAPIADRVIRMHDGRVTAVETNERPMDIQELEWWPASEDDIAPSTARQDKFATDGTLHLTEQDNGPGNRTAWAQRPMRNRKTLGFRRFQQAPATGLEPVTVRLTVGCSAN